MVGYRFSYGIISLAVSSYTRTNRSRVYMYVYSTLIVLNYIPIFIYVPFSFCLLHIFTTAQSIIHHTAPHNTTPVSNSANYCATLPPSPPSLHATVHSTMYIRRYSRHLNQNTLHHHHPRRHTPIRCALLRSSSAQYLPVIHSHYITSFNTLFVSFISFVSFRCEMAWPGSSSKYDRPK